MKRERESEKGKEGQRQIDGDGAKQGYRGRERVIESERGKILRNVITA